MSDRHVLLAKFGATRWPSHDYASPGAYFVTACAHQRLKIFERPSLAAIVRQAWDDIPNHFPNVALDAFVVMPNHVHGLLIFTDDGVSVAPQHAEALRRPASLSVVIRSFKAAATREARMRRLWERDRLWQPNYYDRVVHNEAELNRAREYVAHNPIAWQFDSENPDRIADEDYARLWGWLENTKAP